MNQPLGPPMIEINCRRGYIALLNFTATVATSIHQEDSCISSISVAIGFLIPVHMTDIPSSKQYMSPEN